MGTVGPVPAAAAPVQSMCCLDEEGVIVIDGKQGGMCSLRNTTCRTQDTAVGSAWLSTAVGLDVGNNNHKSWTLNGCHEAAA
jgi:hypothetical protein